MHDWHSQLPAKIVGAIDTFPMLAYRLFIAPLNPGWLTVVTMFSDQVSI